MGMTSHNACADPRYSCCFSIWFSGGVFFCFITFFAIHSLNINFVSLAVNLIAKNFFPFEFFLFWIVLWMRLLVVSYSGLCCASVQYQKLNSRKEREWNGYKATINHRVQQKSTKITTDSPTRPLAEKSHSMLQIFSCSTD
jgi:hypothetical protein